MELRSRIRACTWFLIVGLAVSGLTAIPIQSEMALGRALLGDDLSGGGHLPGRVVTWLRTHWLRSRPVVWMSRLHGDVVTLIHGGVNAAGKPESGTTVLSNTACSRRRPVTS